MRLLSKLRTGLLALSLTTAVAFNGNAQTSSCPLEILSGPVYWDAGRLKSVKTQLANSHSHHKAAYKQLISDADEALKQPPYTVTNKTKAGPSGDLKDYVSLSRYFWPNPKKDNGLPYIRKDGQTNPEINGIDFDRRRSGNMTEAVSTLSLAAYLSGNQAYADKAQSLVRAWFLDETTGMNPHLSYAQNVPGVTDGREFGILDGRIYWDVIDGMLLLQAARMIDGAFVNELRGWFGNYATWLVTSEFGKKAKTKKNNHGVYYDAQLTHILMFAGRCDLAKKIIKSGHDRTKTQIDKTGLMPEETERTQSLFYHAFNLRAFLRLAYYGRRLDMDFYETAKRGSGSVKDSVEFVASYAGRTEEWPYEEINQNVEKSLWDMLVRAQWLDADQTSRDALQTLSYEGSKDKDTLLFGN